MMMVKKDEWGRDLLARVIPRSNSNLQHSTIVTIRNLSQRMMRTRLPPLSQAGTSSSFSSSPPTPSSTSFVHQAAHLPPPPPTHSRRRYLATPLLRIFTSPLTLARSFRFCEWILFFAVPLLLRPLLSLWDVRRKSWESERGAENAFVGLTQPRWFTTFVFPVSSFLSFFLLLFLLCSFISSFCQSPSSSDLSHWNQFDAPLSSTLSCTFSST